MADDDGILNFGSVPALISKRARAADSRPSYEGQPGRLTGRNLPSRSESLPNSLERRIVKGIIAGSLLYNEPKPVIRTTPVPRLDIISDHRRSPPIVRFPDAEGRLAGNQNVPKLFGQQLFPSFGSRHQDSP